MDARTSRITCCSAQAAPTALSRSEGLEPPACGAFADGCYSQGHCEKSGREFVVAFPWKGLAARPSCTIRSIAEIAATSW
jgi:hypothetical protein